MALRSVLIAALLALAWPAFAQDRLEVVTTTADLRSLTEAVGGDRVTVTSLVPPNMDAEEYQPKPGRGATQTCAAARARRARLRSVARSPAGADRQAVDRPRRTQLRGRIVRRCRVGAARNERRARRRPRPRQRKPALLAGSEKRRDYHRQCSGSFGTDRPGQCITSS